MKKCWLDSKSSHISQKNFNITFVSKGEAVWYTEWLHTWSKIQNIWIIQILGNDKKEVSVKCRKMLFASTFLSSFSLTVTVFFEEVII